MELVKQPFSHWNRVMSVVFVQWSVWGCSTEQSTRVNVSVGPTESRTRVSHVPTKRILMAEGHL